MSIQSLFPKIKIYEINKEINLNSERYNIDYIQREASLILWAIWKRKRKKRRGKDIQLTPYDRSILANWYIRGQL